MPPQMSQKAIISSTSPPTYSYALRTGPGPGPENTTRTIGVPGDISQTTLHADNASSASGEWPPVLLGLFGMCLPACCFVKFRKLEVI